MIERGDTVTTVKELRKDQKITPPQMADILGIALSTYFDKEAGRRKFKPPEIVQLCTMFNVRVEDVKNFCTENTRKADFKQSTA